MGNDVVATSKVFELKWHYFQDPESLDCPPGAVTLLTRGGISVNGSGISNRTEAVRRGYVAWSPKAQRDKEIEKKYNIFPTGV